MKNSSETYSEKAIHRKREGGGGGEAGWGGTALFLCGFRPLGCYNLFLLKGFPDSSSSFCIFSSFRFSASRLLTVLIRRIVLVVTLLRNPYCY